MKIVKYTILGMLFMLMGIGIVSACSTGTSFKVLNVAWGNSTGFVSAGPGSMDVPLTVSLESYGTTSGNTACTINNLEGQLQVYGDLSNFNGSQYATQYVQQVSPSSIFNMVFYLNIAQNASAGAQTSENYYLYMYYNSSNSTVRESQTLSIEIPMHGSPNITYTPSSYGLFPGLNNVTLKLSNNGTGQASDIYNYVVSSSGVSVIGQPKTIDSLSPGQSKNVSVLLYVQQSSNGEPVVLSVDSHYIDSYGHNTTNNRELGMYIVPASQNVYVYPSNVTLVSGEIQNKSIAIQNNGIYPIYNVSVLLTPQSPLDVLGKNNYIVIPEINAGSSLSFPVTLYSQASSSSTVDTMDASVTYIMNQESQSISRTITFLTPGAINLTQVSSTVLPSAPVQGSIFTITSTLDNLGSESADAASVTAYPPQGISIVGQNTSFIGSIPIDTPTAYTLSFIASPSAKAGTYIIPVSVSYLNNLNQKLNASFEFPVRIGTRNISLASSGAGANAYQGSGELTVRKKSSGHPVIDILVIVLIVGASYYVYRRVKGKQKVRK
ncbi:MAG: hypothetical protein M1122_00670 [Candidatus Marsarchaeota archaeon]|nr:hypothetical protein [Candidatus Marsarchaeota archaeon]